MAARFCDQCGKAVREGGKAIGGELWCDDCLDGIDVVTPGAPDEDDDDSEPGNLFDERAS